MSAKPGLIPLGDANAVVCEGDVCLVPAAPAAAAGSASASGSGFASANPATTPTT